MAHEHNRCFFCRGKGLTKEHVWPRWMARYLPVQQGFGQFYVRTMSDELEIVQPRKALSHKITSLTARVVCKFCNNQWMSLLEKSVEPVIAPMIQGHAVSLHNEHQRVLARWIAKTLMVMEALDRKDIVSNVADRETVMTAGHPPSDWQIWLGRCDATAWRAGYERTSTTLSDGHSIPIARNMQAMSLGVGALFVHAVASPRPAQFYFKNDVSKYLVKLWPITSDPATVATSQHSY